MTTINIKVDIDNDAFVDRLTDELCDVLDVPHIVNGLSDAGLGSSINLYDSNGNTCGEAWVSEQPADHWAEGGEMYPVCDWQYEVANSDTRLGYADWLEHQKEAAE